MHWRGIKPRSPAWQARILQINHQCDKRLLRFVGQQALTRKKKNETNWGNVGALYFGGAMERLARAYSSVVELSTADRMVSGSNPDVPCLLGIGVPCE